MDCERIPCLSESVGKRTEGVGMGYLQSSFSLAAPSTTNVNTRDSIELEMVPLQQRIQTLPIGFFVGRERLIGFKLATYTSRHDMEIIKCRSRYPDDLHSLAQHIFPQLITSIEGRTWAELARLLGMTIEQTISQMPVADVLTMVCNIRALEISPAIYLQSTCPECGRNCSDRPEFNECHDLSQIDIVFARSLSRDLLRSFVTRGGSIVRLYPLQLCDLNSYLDMDFDPDLKYAAACIYQIDGVYDRQTDGALDPHIYARVFAGLSDRHNLLAIAREFAALGPQMSTDEDCPGCKFTWTSKLPIEANESFYDGLLATPSEADIVKMAFFLSFGEQAPCKSNEEIMNLPIRERDALIQTLSETYQKQEKEMKKKGKGGKTESVSY